MLIAGKQRKWSNSNKGSPSNWAIATDQYGMPVMLLGHHDAKGQFRLVHSPLRLTIANSYNDYETFLSVV